MCDPKLSYPLPGRGVPPAGLGQIRDSPPIHMGEISGVCVNRRCSELDPIFRIITRKWTELQGRTSTKVLRDVQLLELDVSVLGLPELLLLGLDVPRCLDEVPLGLLLVLLLELLGQALKEQILVQLDNLNSKIQNNG